LATRIQEDSNPREEEEYFHYRRFFDVWEGMENVTALQGEVESSKVTGKWRFFFSFLRFAPCLDSSSLASWGEKRHRSGGDRHFTDFSFLGKNVTINGKGKTRGGVLDEYKERLDEVRDLTVKLLTTEWLVGDGGDGTDLGASVGGPEEG
jgi:hypothetical protein